VWLDEELLVLPVFGRLIPTWLVVKLERNSVVDGWAS
jgi:hypothetical protein